MHTASHHHPRRAAAPPPSAPTSGERRNRATADGAPAVVVAGLGDTGLSCVRHLQALGEVVAVTDTRRHPPQLDTLRREFPQVPLRLGGLDREWLHGARTIVLSPGLDPQLPSLRRARAAGATIIGDIELFARARDAPVLAVTGSNGKSTVACLCGAICGAAGLQPAVGGNLGPPALELLGRPGTGVYVLELSSFQLQSSRGLRPRAAVVLNLAPDHSDRHPDMARYAEAKARIYDGAATRIINRDDPAAAALAPPSAAAGPGLMGPSFGSNAPPGAADYGVIVKDGAEWLARGEAALLPVAQLPLPGRHNRLNVMAAMALAEAAGAAPAAMPAAIAGFRGLPHRCEVLGVHRGVRWVNDSKGTNTGATCAALAALAGDDGGVVLIAGGDGKGADFTPLRRAVARHARHVILFGRDAPAIEAALRCDAAPSGRDAVPLSRCETLEQAVATARAVAHSGDTVLLSPACASFDMFHDYRERGECFRRLVEQAAEGGV